MLGLPRKRPILANLLGAVVLAAFQGVQVFACEPGTAELRWNGGTATVNVALAKTARQKSRGLMFIRNLPENDGMLFLYERDAHRSFWMRNTYVPLDIAYFDEKGHLVSIAKGRPLDETPLPSAGPARYVLEVNEGWFARQDAHDDVQMRATAMEQAHLDWSCDN